MFTEILHGLNSMGKICISTYQNSSVINPSNSKFEHLNSEPDIHAFFDISISARLKSSETNLKVW